ncbi:MAG: cellulose synthase complex periplasmic endoglucanase BcsZ [Acidobacteriaceae bacterium]
MRRRYVAYAVYLVAMLLPPVLHAQPHAQSRRAWPFWAAYQQHFISPDGRVIDPSRASMTTSEGQSYALFFSLVANDSQEFERIRQWTQDNLADGSLAQNLPAWSWGKNARGGWGILDRNSAADADLWIAYSLLQAGRLWRNPAYTHTGKALLAQIAQQEVASVPGLGVVLMPGRTTLFSDHGRWILNESYSPLPLLLAAASADAAGPWRQMATDLPPWLQQASPSGFAMNWVEWSMGKFTAVADPSVLRAATAAGAAPAHGYGSYDAIRVYLWAGITDPRTPGAAKILSIFAPMARLLAQGQRPPEIVSPGGAVLSPNSPVGFAAALMPFLLRSGDPAAAAAELHRVNAQVDRSTGLLDADPRYYDQNLALFALGWKQNRFHFAADGRLRVPWSR